MEDIMKVASPDQCYVIKSTMERPSPCFSRCIVYVMAMALLLCASACSDPSEGQRQTPVHTEEKVPVPKPVEVQLLSAEILSPQGNAVVYDGRPVRFSGRIAGGVAPYSIRWDFGKEAVPVNREDAGEVVFRNPGRYDVFFEVKDAGHNQVRKRVSIEVMKDTKPVPRITSPGENIKIREGESVVYKTLVRDGNGPLQYAWSFGRGIPASTAKDPGPVVYPAAGTFSTVLVVKDEHGDAGQDEATVHVERNVPKAVIATPLKDMVIYEGRSARFSGAATDGNPPYRHHWDFGGAGASDVEDPGDVRFIKPGTYTIRYTVRDVHGDQAEDSISVRVIEDIKPLARITSPASDLTVCDDAPVTFSGTVTGGNDPVRVSWNFQGAAPEVSDKGPRQVRFPDPGTYRVSFRATDAAGNASEDSVRITVIRDTVPKAAITEPSSNRIIAEKGKVLFHGSATGGNEPLSFVWQFGDGGNEWRGKDPGEIAFPTAGNYSVRFMVKDADGDVASASVMITVVKDSKPSAVLALPEGDVEVFEGETVSFKGTVKDGNTPIRFKWDFDGAAKNSDKAVPGEVAFPKAGVFKVALTVRDADGDTDTLTRTITVVKSPWKYASGGWANSAALKSDGTLWAWGMNNCGQLGTGNTRSSTYPIRVGDDADWAGVSVGGGYMLALRSDGSLWGWGANGKGQVGNGTLRHVLVPVRIGGGFRWKEISAGTSHSLAVREDGSLWAWGRNAEGQLGIGTRTSSSVPVRVGGDSDWRLVAAGEGHSLGLKTDGTLWAWGANDLGQLGDETQKGSPVPRQVAPEMKWSAIAAGKKHSVAVSGSGELYAWGANMWGRLGDGTRALKYSPVRIGKDSNWKMVSAGEYHTIAMKKNGTVWTWGLNVFGQLGYGNTKDSYRPVQMGPDWDWVTIDAGDHHCLGIRKNGSLWTWGYNGYSQIGDNDSKDRHSPAFIRPGKK